ncbi:MAG TPA: hypothetical protein VNZ57_03205 [Longimicrobiales bacterium]|nr:hypothetical protein [Longimicrobiales bacterium]
MSPAGQRLWSAIAAAHHRVRRDTLLAIIGLAAAVVPVVLVVAWLAGGGELWTAPSPAPLVLELVGLAVAIGIGAWAAKRWLAGLDEARIAAAAEARAGLPDGSVRGLLELRSNLPPGTSAALAARAEVELAQRLAGASARDLAGDLGVNAARLRSRALMAVAGLAIATLALGFASPDRSREVWTPLLNPVRHLTPPPLPPLLVEPGNVEVPRGGDVQVVVRTAGRSSIAVRWVAQGDVPQQRTVRAAADVAITQLTGIDAPLRYWVTAPDGAVSDTFTITPVDPLLVSDLVVDLIFPEYLGRSPERYEGDVPPLLIPAGTVLDIQGRSTRPLAAVELRRADAESRVELVVAGDRFSGRWTPSASGVYEWQLSGTGNDAPAGVPAPIELVLVPDSAPRVEVTFPGTDTILGRDFRQALVAHARDDHGLRSAAVVSWRVGALGGAEAPVEQSIELSGSPDRAALNTVLDLSDRGLLAGDTLYYYVRALDASPGGQEGRSRTYALYVPGTDELRQIAQSEADALIDDLGAAAAAARQMEQELRDHQRRAAAGGARQSGVARRPGSAPGGSSTSGTLDHTQAEAARQMLSRQESVVSQLERLRERTEALERVMEDAGIHDPELQRRVEEMRELYEQMLTPELRQQLAALRQGIEELDAEEVERALQAMAERQQELREQIEQNLALMRRAAAEQQMNALAEEARRLAAQQEALAEAMRSEGEPSQERIEQQQRLAEEAAKLNEALAALQTRLGQMGESGAAAQTSEARERSGDATDAMKRAAEQAAQRQGQQAGEAGEQAAQSLSEVAESLDSTRQQMAEAWREETQTAVRQAAMDAIALAERQTELLEEMRRAQEQGMQQGGMSPPDQPSPGSSPQSGSPQQGDAARPGESSKPDGQADPAKGQQDDAGTASAADPSRPDSGGAPPRPGNQGSAGDSGNQGQRSQLPQSAQDSGDDAGGDNRRAQQGEQGQQGQRGQQGGSGNSAGDQGQQGQQGQGQAGQQGGGGTQGQQGQQTAQADAGGRDGAGSASSDSGGQGGQRGGSTLDELRSQQAALDQSIRALGRNLAEAGQESALINRDVSAALARALLNSEQTLEALSEGGADGNLPVEQAEQSVEALNQLALALLQNEQQIAQSESGTGVQEALSQLAELARQQGALSGQGRSLSSLGVSPDHMQRQLEAMATQQQEIAGRIEGVGSMLGGQNDLLGRLEQLAQEAAALAMELAGGRLTPEVVARQERLFHRLLDAGRTLERDEVSSERVAQRSGDVGTSEGSPLDASLLDAGLAYRVPDAAQLSELPPALRRLVLEYFDRLNGIDVSGDEPAR